MLRTQMTERTFRIHVAAQMSGVSEDLIRAWERRYSVVQPNRTPSGYRVYSELDVALLKRLKQLTHEGMSIAEASRLVPQLRVELSTSLGRPFPERETAPLSGWRDEIIEAGRRGDQRRVDEVLDEAFAAVSPLRAYDGLVKPLLEHVGQLWQGNELSVVEEHLVSQSVRMRLIALLHAAPQGNRRHVLCACFPDEQHEIGLLGAALRFRHSGWRVTVLGQRTPVRDLVKLVQVVRPDLLALSCVMDVGLAEIARVVSELRQALPEVALLVGGAAAKTHAEQLEQLGVRVHRDDADWSSEVV